jgi:putative glutamine amidotransferase
MRRNQPIIGVISDRRTLGHHAFQVQGEKYLRAVVMGSGGLPLGIPCLGDSFDATGILDVLDGLLLTGSPSNVEPIHYRGAASREGTMHDAERDLLAFALIPAAIRAGLPLLAICRGFQELNVAFGGSLHQELHTVPGVGKHREDRGEPVEIQYAPAHEVRFTAGGLLVRITGRDSAQVNSLHGQGIDQLGAGLVVDAVAPDGVIEAIVVADTPGFALGVQWHPEWRVQESEVSMAIFQAFGDACRSYRS